MGSFLETVYDVLFNPQEAMRSIAEKKLTRQALAMFIIGMLVPVWTVYAGIRDMSGVPAIGFLFILHSIGSFFFWVISAAVLAFVAELFGGRGTAVGLFAALGFSHLPRVAVMPLWVIASLLPAGFQAVAFGTVGVIIVIWTLSLYVAALRGAHGLSVVKAVLVLMAPMLALLGTIALLIVFAGSALINLPFYG
jgi:hypothetical protein